MSTHSKTDDEEKMTPTKELGRILDSFVEGSQKRSKCVLLATGSFNPIHKGHLYQFEMAKEFLGKVHNLDVIAGYISPSADAYVGRKLGSEALPFVERAVMCEKAIEDHRKGRENALPIFVDRWEGSQQYFIDFPEVTELRTKYLEQKFPDKEFSVLFLCGLDLYDKCGLYSWSYVVAVSRPGYMAHRYAERYCKPKIVHNYLMEPGTGGEYELKSDISSTDMRKHRSKERLLQLTYPSVVEHLEKELHWTRED